MKPSPPGWPRISTAVYYVEPRAAIDWLCDAFGFEVRLLIEGEPGTVEHSELTFGDGLVMVGGLKPEKFPQRKAPSQLGGANTQNLMVYVDDVEAHFQNAKARGAKIVKEPETTDYGEEYWTDRGYECEDPEGHRWWFYQRLHTGKGRG